MSSLFPETVDEARIRVRKHRRDTGGVLCPCCDRNATERRRAFHAEMGVFICRLVRLWQQEARWYLSSEIVGGPGKNSSDASYAVAHGLIERSSDEIPGHAPRSGAYRPTERGVEFALGELRVPSHFWTYGGEVTDTDGPFVSIRDVLGTKFDWDELMGRPARPGSPRP